MCFDFEYGGPTTRGTKMIVKLEAVIYNDAKEFDARFR